MKKLISVVILSLLSFNSFADNEGFYFAFGGGAMQFENSVGTLENKQLLMRLGYDITEHFGVGVERGFSVIKDDMAGMDFDLSLLFFYLRLSLPFGDGNKLYAMAGPSNLQLTPSFNRYPVGMDKDDSGAGVGLEVGIDSGALFIDYINYFEDDGVEAKAVNIGYTRYF
jgi:hypothetical protein